MSQRTAIDLMKLARGLGVRIEGVPGSEVSAVSDVETVSNGWPSAAEGQAAMPLRKRRGRPPKTAPITPDVGAGSTDIIDV